MKFSKEQMLEMYEKLQFSRVMGEKIVEFIFSGRIAGAIHPSLGQEAVNAGLMSAVDYTDLKVFNTFTHRQQPLMQHRLGLDPFLGELLNKSTGCNKGVSGEYHVCDIPKGALPGQGILGGAWTTATGFAWAVKHDQDRFKNSVVMTSYGDGACSEGATYEAMNIAAVMKLPILFVIENNGVAMSTPLEKQSPIEDLYLRAAACGMPGAAVDGNDVEAVTEAILEGLALAGKNQPNVIELKTWRWEGHFVGDKQEAYRDTSFREDLDAICPVRRYEKQLKERGLADDAYFKKVYEEQQKIISEGFDRAIAADYPTKEEVLDYNKMYATNSGGAL